MNIKLFGACILFVSSIAAMRESNDLMKIEQVKKFLNSMESKGLTAATKNIVKNSPCYSFVNDNKELVAFGVSNGFIRVTRADTVTRDYTQENLPTEIVSYFDEVINERNIRGRKHGFDMLALK